MTENLVITLHQSQVSPPPDPVFMMWMAGAGAVPVLLHLSGPQPLLGMLCYD